MDDQLSGTQIVLANDVTDAHGYALHEDASAAAHNKYEEAETRVDNHEATLAFDESVADSTTGGLGDESESQYESLSEKIVKLEAQQEKAETRVDNHEATLALDESYANSTTDGLGDESEPQHESLSENTGKLEIAQQEEAETGVDNYEATLAFDDSFADSTTDRLGDESEPPYESLSEKIVKLEVQQEEAGTRVDNHEATLALDESYADSTTDGLGDESEPQHESLSEKAGKLEIVQQEEAETRVDNYEATLAFDDSFADSTTDRLGDESEPQLAALSENSVKLEGAQQEQAETRVGNYEATFSFDESFANSTTGGLGDESEAQHESLSEKSGKLEAAQQEEAEIIVHNPETTLAFDESFADSATGGLGDNSELQLESLSEKSGKLEAAQQETDDVLQDLETSTYSVAEGELLGTFDTISPDGHTAHREIDGHNREGLSCALDADNSEPQLESLSEKSGKLEPAQQETDDVLQDIETSTDSVAGGELLGTFDSISPDGHTAHREIDRHNREGLSSALASEDAVMDSLEKSSAFEIDNVGSVDNDGGYTGTGPHSGELSDGAVPAPTRDSTGLLDSHGASEEENLSPSSATSTDSVAQGELLGTLDTISPDGHTAHREIHGHNREGLSSALASEDAVMDSLEKSSAFEIDNVGSVDNDGEYTGDGPHSGEFSDGAVPAPTRDSIALLNSHGASEEKNLSPSSETSTDSVAEGELLGTFDIISPDGHTGHTEIEGHNREGPSSALASEDAIMDSWEKSSAFEIDNVGRVDNDGEYTGAGPHSGELLDGAVPAPTRDCIGPLDSHGTSEEENLSPSSATRESLVAKDGTESFSCNLYAVLRQELEQSQDDNSLVSGTLNQIEVPIMDMSGIRTLSSPVKVKNVNGNYPVQEVLSKSEVLENETESISETGDVSICERSITTGSKAEAAGDADECSLARELNAPSDRSPETEKEAEIGQGVIQSPDIIENISDCSNKIWNEEPGRASEMGDVGVSERILATESKAETWDADVGNLARGLSVQGVSILETEIEVGRDGALQTAEEIENISDGSSELSNNELGRSSESAETLSTASATVRPAKVEEAEAFNLSEESMSTSTDENSTGQNGFVNCGEHELTDEELTEDGVVFAHTIGDEDSFVSLHNITAVESSEFLGKGDEPSSNSAITSGSMLMLNEEADSDMLNKPILHAFATQFEDIIFQRELVNDTLQEKSHSGESIVFISNGPTDDTLEAGDCNVESVTEGGEDATQEVQLAEDSLKLQKEHHTTDETSFREELESRMQPNPNMDSDISKVSPLERYLTDAMCDNSLDSALPVQSSDDGDVANSSTEDITSKRVSVGLEPETSGKLPGEVSTMADLENALKGRVSEANGKIDKEASTSTDCSASLDRFPPAEVSSPEEKVVDEHTTDVPFRLEEPAFATMLENWNRQIVRSIPVNVGTSSLTVVHDSEEEGWNDIPETETESSERREEQAQSQEDATSLVSPSKSMLFGNANLEEMQETKSLPDDDCVLVDSYVDVRHLDDATSGEEEFVDEDNEVAEIHTAFRSTPDTVSQDEEKTTDLIEHSGLEEVGSRTVDGHVNLIVAKEDLGLEEITAEGMYDSVNLISAKEDLGLEEITAEGKYDSVEQVRPSVETVSGSVRLTSEEHTGEEIQQHAGLCSHLVDAPRDTELENCTDYEQFETQCLLSSHLATDAQQESNDGSYTPTLLGGVALIGEELQQYDTCYALNTSPVDTSGRMTRAELQESSTDNEDSKNEHLVSNHCFTRDAQHGNNSESELHFVEIGVYDKQCDFIERDEHLCTEEVAEQVPMDKGSVAIQESQLPEDHPALEQGHIDDPVKCSSWVDLPALKDFNYTMVEQDGCAGACQESNITEEENKLSTSENNTAQEPGSRGEPLFELYCPSVSTPDFNLLVNREGISSLEPEDLARDTDDALSSPTLSTVLTPMDVNCYTLSDSCSAAEDEMIDSKDVNIVGDDFVCGYDVMVRHNLLCTSKQAECKTCGLLGSMDEQNVSGRPVFVAVSADIHELENATEMGKVSVDMRNIQTKQLLIPVSSTDIDMTSWVNISPVGQQVATVVESEKPFHGFKQESSNFQECSEDSAGSNLRVSSLHVEQSSMKSSPTHSKSDDLSTFPFSIITWCSSSLSTLLGRST